MKDLKKTPHNKQEITRKEALKKVGVTALTATTLFFLQTKSYAATSNGDTITNAAKPGTRGRGQ